MKTPENASASYLLAIVSMSKLFYLYDFRLTLAIFAALIDDKAGLKRICIDDMDELSIQKKRLNYSSDEESEDTIDTADRKNPAQGNRVISMDAYS